MLTHISHDSSVVLSLKKKKGSLKEEQVKSLEHMDVTYLGEKGLCR